MSAMKCQLCGKNPATIHYTEIVEGEKTSQWICESCAARQGVASHEASDLHHGSLESIVGELLSGAAEPPAAPGPARAGERTRANGPVCDVCGYRYEALKKSGMLGCPACYVSFRRQLLPMLRRYHGEVRHVGKLPRRQGPRAALQKEIGRLKVLLEQAVAQESYETAASLRDEIRAKERQAELLLRAEAAGAGEPDAAGGGVGEGR